jgi:acylphosphatase
MSTAAKLVRYSGDVQGVGFRYTAMRLAQGFDVDGYVKNLFDGDVELYAEGSDDQVQAYLQALRDRMGAYIRDVNQQDRPPSGKLSGFDIRF